MCKQKSLIFVSVKETSILIDWYDLDNQLLNGEMFLQVKFQLSTLFLILIFLLKVAGQDHGTSVKA